MKTVLITVASSGIGKETETAFVYAENNYNLILAARRKENLEAMK